MKHISFVIGGMTRGGAERVISILANHYAQKKWKVDILMMLDYKIDYELDPSIRLFDMTVDKNQRLKSVPKWLSLFRKYVIENRPDVIVSFVARINLIVLLSTLGLDIPIIVSERNDPNADGRSKIIDIFTNLLYPRAKKIVFQTRRAREYFRKKIQGKGVIILNPISVEKPSFVKKEKIIVTAGRLAPQKNHKLLIRAFSNVVKKHPEYNLYIYGNGAEMKLQLESLIEDLKLTNSVFLPGNVTNIHEKLSESEVFVLSSDYEGLSNALLEAMMLGLPCISTNCAGSDEIITSGKDGILVPVNDTDALSKAIVYLIENPDIRKTLSENAKSKVSICEYSNVIKEWENCIES